MLETPTESGLLLPESQTELGCVDSGCGSACVLVEL